MLPDAREAIPEDGVRGWFSAQELALALFLLLVLLPFLPGASRRIEQFDLPKEAALGMIGIASAFSVLSSASRRPLGVALWRVGLVFGWASLLALVVAPNQSIAWRTIGGFAAAVSLLMFAVATGTRSEGRRFSRLVGGMSLVVSGLVLLEAFGGSPIFSAPGQAPGGALGNRNLAARVLCLFLPLLWFGLVSTVRDKGGRWMLVPIGCAVAAIVISRSRGAWLVGSCLVVGLPLCWRWYNQQRIDNRDGAPAIGRWYLSAFVGVTFAIALPNKLSWETHDFMASARSLFAYDSGTGRGRVIQAATTFRMVSALPLTGVGPGNWSVVYPGYSSMGDPSVRPYAFYPAPRVPRADLPSLASELGLIGMALLVMLSLDVFRHVRRAFALGGWEQREWLGVAAITSLAGLLLGFLDSVIRPAPTVATLCVIVGFAVGRGSSRVHGELPHETAAASRFRRVVLTCLLLASGTHAFAALQDIASLRILHRSRDEAQLRRAVDAAPANVEDRLLLSFALALANRCQEALPHARHAARLQPFSLSAQRLVAQCERQLQSEGN